MHGGAALQLCGITTALADIKDRAQVCQGQQQAMGRQVLQYRGHSQRAFHEAVGAVGDTGLHHTGQGGVQRREPAREQHTRLSLLLPHACQRRLGSSDKALGRGSDAISCTV